MHKCSVKKKTLEAGFVLPAKFHLQFLFPGRRGSSRRGSESGRSGSRSSASCTDGGNNGSCSDCLHPTWSSHVGSSWARKDGARAWNCMKFPPNPMKLNVLAWNFISAGSVLCSSELKDGCRTCTVPGCIVLLSESWDQLASIVFIIWHRPLWLASVVGMVVTYSIGVLSRLNKRDFTVKPARPIQKLGRSTTRSNHQDIYLHPANNILFRLNAMDPGLKLNIWHNYQGMLADGCSP